MLNLAKQNIGEIPNVKYILNDFMEFNSDKKYDLFFSSRAIEYFKDKEGTIKKVYDLIKPGGVGLIITKTPHYFKARIRGRKISDIHSGQIGPSDMRKIIIGSGFRDVEIYPATTTFPLLRSSFLNKLIFYISRSLSLNPVSESFSESYIIKFTK